MVLAGLTLLPVPPATASDTWREQSRQTVEARGLKGVKVENSRGQIVVHRSSDSNVRLVALKTVRSRCREHSLRMARGTEVTSTTDDGWLVIRARYPQRQVFRIGFWEFFGGFDWPKVELKLDLEVPDHMPVWLHSTSGDLATEELNGPQNLETVSGDVSVSAAGGPVNASSTSGAIAAVGLGHARLRTVSGDLEVEGVRGSLRAGSTSGEIKITGAQDSLSLSTVSGDIEVSTAPRGLTAKTTSGAIVATSAAGDVQVETVSGDVRVGMDGRLRRVDVSTTSGEIDLRLANSVGCALEMRTSSGSLDAAVPIEIETVSRRKVVGAVRGGGGPVRLRSLSGDITVRSGGS